MRVDSLGRLESAFGKWRLKKRHIREPVPEKLMERARRVAAVYGVYAVAQAVKIDYCRLADGMASATKSAGRSAPRGGDATAGHESKRAPARRAKKTALAATRTKKCTAAVPSYSRIEVPAPETAARPLAEVETPMGVKLRVFTITPETVTLLTTLSGPGRAP